MRFRKAAAALAALYTVLSCALPARAVSPAPQTAAQAAILVEADTGVPLWEHNADEPMLIASTTKILTALLTIERCSPDEPVEVTWTHASVEGSSMYLKPGEPYTVEQLLYGLMLASGNDAALALACHVAGSPEAFAELMNERAAELGMEHSHFENPHGLDGKNHRASARDMARLTVAAMKNETFRRIVSCKTYSVGENTYRNHNKLLWNCPGCIGVKTGYTNAAGRSLISCCQRDGMTLICITLGDSDDWNDHMALYDWAFSTYERVPLSSLAALPRVPIVSGVLADVGVEAAEDVLVPVARAERPAASVELPAFVFAGVHRGERAGCIWLRYGEERVTVQLVYAADAPEAKGIRLTLPERLLRLSCLQGVYYPAF